MLLGHFKDAAKHCRTPNQFRALLKELRTVIPYGRLYTVRGHPSKSTMQYFFNIGFPMDFLRWRWAHSALWTSPVFQEWLVTNKAVIWSDAAERHKKHLHPELLRQMVEHGVQFSMCGGEASLEKDSFILFVVDMGSESKARATLPLFEQLLPILVAAGKRAYPKSLLTTRERAILEQRMSGQIVKQIAHREKISERTVTEHLTRIKKKLYTNDLVNACIIAVRIGAALPPLRGEQ